MKPEGECSDENRVRWHRQEDTDVTYLPTDKRRTLFISVRNLRYRYSHARLVCEFRINFELVGNQRIQTLVGELGFRRD